MNKPICKVHGMIQRGAMCSKIIVGGKYCGHDGDCPHKGEPEQLVVTLDPHAMLLAKLSTAKVGDRVNFEGERMPYTVQARNDRYLICTKPFAPQRTVIYTIVDMTELVRGPDNLVFGMGYETRGSCQERLADLMDPDDCAEISRRNRVVLRVTKVRRPTANGAAGQSDAALAAQQKNGGQHG